MTIRETIKKGMINLKTNGIEEPNLKARLLMQFILNKPRQYLLIYDKVLIDIFILLNIIYEYAVCYYHQSIIILCY